jgi:hypothetical protein
MKKKPKMLSIAPENEIMSLLYRPTAGCEIPNHLRQTLMQMVLEGQVKEAGLDKHYARRYDLAIFWRAK